MDLLVALNYVLFRVNKAYTNLFDATVDALVAALQKLGFPNIPVMGTGTGWPTAGNTAATPEKAAAYKQGIGTLMRPNDAVEVLLLFNLFDQNRKTVKEYEKHFVIFHQVRKVQVELVIG
uniref:Glucan endo-1,3-beta-D-glucosidase n=2 Tax=Musa acuminata subsp. malaccensis TaxID=214687 RepID=A0A804HQP5_MUSAM|nr:PREDICTED: glucan endo-1,3-beta-glucosidase, acidic-like [Musa acuminata subsp. malaccensis]